MSNTFTRGACPRLAAPMQTGDGLLARIVPAGPMALDAFAALCDAALAYGNGVMEVSARGSIQVRGLTPSSAPRLAAAVEALDLDINDGVPVLSSPLPDDPFAPIDAQRLAAELRDAILAATLDLAPKVSVVVDGAGQVHLDALTADIRLRAVQTEAGPMMLVSLAGDASSATPLGTVSPHVAPDVTLDLLRVVATCGPHTRAVDVLQREGATPFLTAAHERLNPALEVPPRTPAETIGLHRLKTKACAMDVAMGVALEFGQSNAGDLAALVGIAAANGAAWIATAPGRTLLLGPIGEMTAFALATAADHLGFVVDARDARRRVVACPGAPACASGFIAARAIAAEIAAALPPAQTGVAAHVSGCGKGCAHPAPAPLTLVGTENGCGFVRDGTARSAPEGALALHEITIEASRLCTRTPETEHA